MFMAQIAFAGARLRVERLKLDQLPRVALLHIIEQLEQGIEVFLLRLKELDRVVGASLNTFATARTLIINDQNAALIPNEGLFGACLDAFGADSTLMTDCHRIELADRCAMEV